MWRHRHILPSACRRRFCLSDGATPCVQNSDCTHGGGCAYDGPTFTATAASLTAYGATSGADSVSATLAPVQSSLGSATASLLTVPSVSQFSSQLSSVQSSLAAVPTSSSLSAVATLQSQLSPSNLDLGSARRSISSAKSASDSAASQLSGVRSQIVSFNGSLASVKSQAHSLGNLAVQFCNGEARGRAFSSKAAFVTRSLKAHPRSVCSNNGLFLLDGTCSPVPAPPPSLPYPLSNPSVMRPAAV